MSEMAIAEVQSVRSLRPILTRSILEQETEQRKLLGEYIQKNMVEGTDYGVIPGTKDRTLLKPGAEKLTDLFRCTPEYIFIEKTEDFDRPLFHYVIHCKVTSRESGTVIAEGFGSCNSREGKYRWRMEERKCPVCGKPAILRSKFPPREDPGAEPGWYCFAKKGGCGASFPANDKAIVSQTMERVENDDVATLVNTILKMAKKRSLVDAALGLARCSDMFTQDMEDTGEHHDKTPAKTEAKEKTQDEPKFPPDAAAVNAYLDKINGCKYQTELVKLAAVIKDDPNLTDAGKIHLRSVWSDRKKQIPVAPPVHKSEISERDAGEYEPDEIPFA